MYMQLGRPRLAIRSILRQIPIWPYRLETDPSKIRAAVSLLLPLQAMP